MTESIKILSECAELQARKGADYQNPNSSVRQADYYPNGVQTINDVIWAKMLRLKSLLESGAEPNFEAIDDTYKDLINYASFGAAWVRGGVPGQDPSKGLFNRFKTIGIAATGEAGLTLAQQQHERSYPKKVPGNTTANMGL